MGAAERPRDRVEADRRHALLGERLSRLRIDQGAEETDYRLALAHHADLGITRLLDAEDDVRLGVELDRRHDRRAGLRVRLIRDLRARARAGLDEDLEPGLGELAERFGYQGDAPLAGRSLLGDADLHGHHLTWDLGIVLERPKDTGRRTGA